MPSPKRAAEPGHAEQKAEQQPAPSAEERARIAKAARRMAARELPPRVKTKTTRQGDGVSLEISATHSDRVGHRAHLIDSFGTRSADVTNMLLSQLADAVTQSRDVSEAQVNGALAAVHGIAPQDEAEAMLAVQMVATHTAALNALRRAQTVEYLSQVNSWGNLATKLLRTYTAQLETLARYRRRGAQTVRVEHVHVAPGAQAIVGPVTHVAGGGGQDGNGDQPHAPGPEQRKSDNDPLLEFQPGTPLWGSDPSRDAMPVASREGQAPLPDARRSARQRGAGG